MKIKEEKYYSLLALSLGDGSVYKSYLDIAHHIKNDDYILFKSKILEEFDIQHKITTKKTATSYLERIRTNRYKIFQYIQNNLYENNVKIFRKNWIKNLHEFSLAILWMDDGCFIKQRQKLRTGKPYIYECGEIATQSFNLESNKNIVEWLKKFDISAYILHDKKRDLYRIKLNRDNTYKLVEVIKPIVNRIPSMRYKLGY